MGTFWSFRKYVKQVNVRWLEPVQVSQSSSLSSQPPHSWLVLWKHAGVWLAETCPLMRLYGLLNTPRSFSLSLFQTASTVLDRPLALSSPGKTFDFLYLFFFNKSEDSCANGAVIVLSDFRNPSRWISLSILFINKVLPNWFWDSAVRGTTRFLQERATPTSLRGY